MLQRIWHRIDHEDDLPRHQIVHRWACTSIWHELKERADLVLEEDPGDV
jgi:hypothetical protein